MRFWLVVVMLPVLPAVGRTRRSAQREDEIEEADVHKHSLSLSPARDPVERHAGVTVESHVTRRTLMLESLAVSEFMR